MWHGGVNDERIDCFDKTYFRELRFFRSNLSSIMVVMILTYLQQCTLVNSKVFVPYERKGIE